MTLRTIVTLCAVITVACGSDEPQDTPTTTPTPESAVADVRLAPPPLPEGATQWMTPDYEVPPYSERQFCYYFTYEGPDTGVDLAEEFQDPTFGHHVIMLKANVSREEYPDGSWFDCTTIENMVDMEPIYIAAENPAVGYHRMTLPSGDDLGQMAVSLKSGTRMVIQSHYVNYSGKTLLVRDAVNLRLVDPALVDTWAGSWSHTDIDLSLPANTETSLEVRCSWDREVTLLNAFGHMHEKGMSVTIDRIPAGTDSRERFYEIPEWEINMRDDFPVKDFGINEFHIQPGDTFVTTCTWFNNSDSDIIFPQEMCASAGMVYPSKVPLVCEAD